MISAPSANTPFTDVAIAPRPTLAEAPSKRSRHQAAMLSLGRRNLTELQAVELEHDVVALIGKTLDATLCALVELLPEALSPTVDQVVCVPPEAAHSGPRLGEPLGGDSLLSAVLEKSTQVLVADVQTDGRYRRTWLQRQGARAAMAVPLVLNGQPQGALVVGHATAGYFDDEDVLFLELIGSILSAQLARARAEEALLQEREYLAALLDSTSALTLTMNQRGVVTRANRACLMQSGLRSDQVIGLPFWLSLCVPTESRLAEASFAQLSAEVAAVEFECTLLTTDGERKYIDWRFCYVFDPREQAPVIVATGVNISRQRVAEQEARQAILAADSAKRLVDELRSLQAGSQTREGQDAIRRGADRRTSQRKLFPFFQQIAPYENGVVPPRDKFASVRCWDISAGGISFLFDEPPPYKAIVVILGSAGNEVLMSANIVRVVELNEEGGPGFLIGCRFMGKI